MGLVSAEFCAQDFVHFIRVGLALGLFHALADEETEYFVLAGAELFDLAGVGGDDGGGVGDLRNPRCQKPTSRMEQGSADAGWKNGQRC